MNKMTIIQVSSVFFILIFIKLIFTSPTNEIYLAKNCLRCYPIDDNKINIHLIPHSHNDVGWLKTVDQYYYGSKSDIQKAGVQYIISSVVEALKENPSRKFIQVETAFFSKWWNDQTNDVKNDFRNLVINGQIEMVNGAWSMNDEATANYQSLIDQFTWGLRFLNDTLGHCGRPKIGWQIDPFGHSREHISLLSQLGFDGLFFARLDFRDLHKRQKQKTMNFLWKTSENLEKNEFFSTVLPNHYSDPEGFCFDILCNDEPIIDNIYSIDYNLDRKVSNFTKLVSNWANYYKTNHLIVPMGNDFNYQSANINFINMDKLIQAFKDHRTLNVFYSTPSCYIEAVNKAVQKKPINFEVKTDDFFPYASANHAFWTGYYTSRPNLKRFERTGNNILQVAKKLFSLAKINKINNITEDSLNDLRESMGIMQHHDAISGTEKQAVVKDYVKLLYKTIKNIEKPISKIFQYLLKRWNSKLNIDLEFSTCLLSNVSICNITYSNQFVVAVFNPLSRPVNHYVRLPISDGTYIIRGIDGKEINDVLDGMNKFDYIKTEEFITNKELIFLVKNIPPLGIKMYYIKKVSNVTENMKNIDINYYGTENRGFEIDPITNLLKSVTMNGKTIQITQEFFYYRSFNGNNTKDKNDTQPSGAYVFRPMEKEVNRFSDSIRITSQRGQLVDEVKQELNSQITQIIRVYKGDDDNYIEFDWLIGDLQVDTNHSIGKEVITKFTIKHFNNSGVFYTDSNGREQIKRQRNKRYDFNYNSTEEPISSNYYPVTSKIVIKDMEQKLQVAILNDRAQGGSSLNDGEIELMIHRRLLKDDHFGVDEPLNETEYDKGVFVRGQHYLILGSTDIHKDNTITAQERDIAQKKLLSPWIFVGNGLKNNLSYGNIEKNFYFKFLAMFNPLPNNVNILTLEPWKDDTFILRLEHTFEKNEDQTLSQPITIDLKKHFIFNITEINETTLGANQFLDDYNKEQKYKWTDTFNNNINQFKSKTNNFKIYLQPMEIRTFIIKIN